MIYCEGTGASVLSFPSLATSPSPHYPTPPTIQGFRVWQLLGPGLAFQASRGHFGTNMNVAALYFAEKTLIGYGIWRSESLESHCTAVLAENNNKLIEAVEVIPVLLNITP